MTICIFLCLCTSFPSFCIAIHHGITPVRLSSTLPNNSLIFSFPVHISNWCLTENFASQSLNLASCVLVAIAEINVYGNHFFQCKKYSKMEASNQIWDGTHFILAKICIYAGITSSQQDVITEPVILVQHNPTCRPADMLVILKPTYATPLHMWSLLSLVTKTMRERSSMVKESNNEHSFVLGKQIIAALNNNSTILLPFMVDPHGGFPTLCLPLSCFMQINHGTRILLISLLEQHTILGSPVPGPVKSLVQTSIPFLHKKFVQQHSQTKLKKSLLMIMNTHLLLDVTLTLLFILLLKNEAITHE